MFFNRVQRYATAMESANKEGQGADVPETMTVAQMSTVMPGHAQPAVPMTVPAQAVPHVSITSAWVRNAASILTVVLGSTATWACVLPVALTTQHVLAAPPASTTSVHNLNAVQTQTVQIRRSRFARLAMCVQEEVQEPATRTATVRSVNKSSFGIEHSYIRPLPFLHFLHLVMSSCGAF